MRAARLATITGFSAATSIRAAWRPRSNRPPAASACASFGIRRSAGTRPSCMCVVDHDRHRPVRRRHRDLVGPHRRLGEVGQRHRVVVPLGHVADDRARVLGAVHPVDLAVALGGVLRVAEHQVDRHPVAPRVVDRHRRVLRAHRGVQAHQHRLALDLRVAVGHRDRDFLVRAGDALGVLVAGVVDDRLVDADEARGAHREHVFHVQRLEDVDHVVGRVPPRRLADLHRRRGWGGCRRRLGGGRLRRGRATLRGHERGHAGGRARLHELAPREFRLTHQKSQRMPNLNSRRWMIAVGRSQAPPLTPE